MLKSDKDTIFYFYFMRAVFFPTCMFVHCVCTQRDQQWNWRCRWLWATMWVLGIEPKSTGRATSALSHWTILPVPRHDFLKVNHKLFCLMNIDAKGHHKMFSNWIQEHIKKIICHNQVDFIPEMPGWFNTVVWLDSQQTLTHPDRE